MPGDAPSPPKVRDALKDTAERSHEPVSLPMNGSPRWGHEVGTTSMPPSHQWVTRGSMKYVTVFTNEGTKACQGHLKSLAPLTLSYPTILRTGCGSASEHLRDKSQTRRASLVS